MILKVGGKETISSRILDNQTYFKIFLVSFILFFMLLSLTADQMGSRDGPGVIAVLIFSFIIAFVIALGFWIKDKVEEM